MLNLSRPEKFFILTLLAIGVFCAGFSYHYKVTNTELEAIDIIETHSLIDINKAGATEIEKLPGIGPVLAHEIVLYREAVAGFKSIDELKRVKGIGDKKFEKIKDRIAISE